MGTCTVRENFKDNCETRVYLCLNAKTYYRYALTTTNQGVYQILGPKSEFARLQPLRLFFSWIKEDPLINHIIHSPYKGYGTIP